MVNGPIQGRTYIGARRTCTHRFAPNKEKSVKQIGIRIRVIFEKERQKFQNFLACGCGVSTLFNSSLYIIQRQGHGTTRKMRVDVILLHF